MPKFEFQAKGHKYLLEGRELISVTQCLPKSPHMKTDEHYGVKGDYVHDACRLYLLNDLDEDDLDPVLVPYLDALKKFLHDSKGMGITGVFDIKSGAKSPMVELQVPAYIELVNQWQVWIKTERESPLLEVPLYHTIYNYAGTPDIVISDGKVREGYALYLKPTGKYSLSPVKDIRKNFEQFIHQLNAYRWRKEKGLI